jgi:hypothetical protein
MLGGLARLRTDARRLLGTSHKQALGSSHRCGYDYYYLLGYDAVYIERSLQTFRRNVLPPSLVSKYKQGKQNLLLVFRFRRCRQYVPPKRRRSYAGIHGGTSQKIELFSEFASCILEPVYKLNKIQIVVLYVVTPCSLVGGYQRFGERCCFHLHG